MGAKKVTASWNVVRLWNQEPDLFSTWKPGVIIVILSAWRSSLLSANNIWLRRPLQVSTLSSGKLSSVAKSHRLFDWKKGKPDACVRVHITKPSSANKKNFFPRRLYFTTRTHLVSTSDNLPCGFFSLFFSKCFIWTRYQAQLELFCHLPKIHRQDPICFPN